MSAPTLLEAFRKHTSLDLDAIDEVVAVQHRPFTDMTCNQAIVLIELSKPKHAGVMREAAREAKAFAHEMDVGEDGLEQLVVDWASVKVAVRVWPHLSPQGYVLLQTAPSLAGDTARTVAHALQQVALFGRAGVPKHRVCIKVPSTLEGLRACRELESTHDVRTLGTTLFSLGQALGAAEAGCTAVSPYLNPLYVHFEASRHVVYDNPVKEQCGVRLTAEIQREYRRRGISTKVKAASFITVEEVVAVTGVDQATIGPGILAQLAATTLTPKLAALQADALTALSARADTLNADKRFSLDEPATELKAALEDPEVKALQEDALERFGRAERELLRMGRESLSAL